MEFFNRLTGRKPEKPQSQEQQQEQKPEEAVVETDAEANAKTADAPSPVTAADVVNAIGSVVSNVGQTAGKIVNDTVETVSKAADVTGDGKFDMKDVSVIADSIKTSFAAMHNNWIERQNQIRRERELQSLAPIFTKDIEDAGFRLDRFIRIAEKDKRHADSELCCGSIGNRLQRGPYTILQIYPENLETFGITVYPDVNQEFYFADPIDPHFYIAVDEYFEYIKQQRIRELQRVAQQLGAKYFRVAYSEKEEKTKTSAVSDKATVQVSPAEKGKAEFSHTANSSDSSAISILCEEYYLGSEPVEPQLVYFANDPQLLGLIERRMSHNVMTDQKLDIEVKKRNGMTEKDALMIDVFLQGVAMNNQLSMKTETKKETNRVLRYELRF